MLEHERDAAHRLEVSQKIIEYVMAIAIPVLLAAMLFSYVLFESLFTPLFVVTLILTVGTIIPAFQALGLHYRCWARNTMPQRLVNGLIGIIYISAASVFGVSLVSTSRGLSPEQPLTFAAVGFLAILLIAIMAYNSKFKVRNEHTELRFFHKTPESLAEEIKIACSSRQEDCQIVRNDRRTSIVFTKSGLAITIAPQMGQSSEVLLESTDLTGVELSSMIKQTLEQEA
jgi:hypothetical protein